MIGRSSRWLALLPCVFLAGCQLFGGGGAVDANGALLTIAVLPPEGMPPRPLGGEGLFLDPARLPLDPALCERLSFPDPAKEHSQAFQIRLITALRERHAATAVLAARDHEEAVRLGADVFVQPTFLHESTRTEGTTGASIGPQQKASEEFVAEGVSSWWSTFTWAMLFVGRWIDDYSYRVQLDLHCKIGNATRLQDAFTRVNATIEAIDTNYYSRQHLLTWRCIGQLFWVPPLTADNNKATRETLTERYIDAVADRLTTFFREDFEWQALQHGEGSIRVRPPQDGSGYYRPGDDLEVELSRRDGPLGWLTATVVPLDGPDGEWPVDLRETAPCFRAECDARKPDADGFYRWSTKVQLRRNQEPQGADGIESAPLERGKSYAVLLSATGDREFSRSLRIRVR